MFDRKDPYWSKAKREGYRSRAAYKLIELQRRFRIHQKGNRVVDLGCAPGGWIQGILAEVGPKGRVVGVDRSPIKPFSRPNVRLITGDIDDPEIQARAREALGGPAALVTSDLSPDLTGIRFQDHCRSCELVRTASRFAVRVLAPGGGFLAKAFQGEELDGLVSELRGSFEGVRRVVPAASRSTSSEIYLIARGYRPAGTANG